MYRKIRVDGESKGRGRLDDLVLIEGTIEDEFHLFNSNITTRSSK